MQRPNAPRPLKRTATVMFQPWGGWSEVFNCILVLRGRSVFARHLADSLSAARSPSCSLANVGSRRLVVAHGLGIAEVWSVCLCAATLKASLRWLQTGCLRLSETPVGRSVRLLASRAANEACCAAPLDFSGDKRGRLREVLASIVNCIPPSLSADSLRFSAGPAQWSYDGSAGRPEGALRIESARIALPDPACVVSLEDWLPRSMTMTMTHSNEVSTHRCQLCPTDSN